MEEFIAEEEVEEICDCVQFLISRYLASRLVCGPIVFFIKADRKVGKSTELTSPLFDTERQVQWQKIMNEKNIDGELDKAARTSFEQ